MAQRWDFFARCETPDAVKVEYRRLAMIHHPDRGGDHETMVELNRQYEDVLWRMSGQEYTASDGTGSYQYTYDQATERKTMDMIASLLSLRMNDVRIELVGTWIWVFGNTRAYKDQLGKAGLGLRFSGKRKAWYYNPKPSYYRRKGYRHGSFDKVRAKYGSRIIQDD